MSFPDRGPHLVLGFKDMGDHELGLGGIGVSGVRKIEAEPAFYAYYRWVWAPALRSRSEQTHGLGGARLEAGGVERSDR